MRLGIVIPSEFANMVNQVVKQEFKDIELKLYVYKDFTEVPELLQGQQQYLDALLFGSEALLSYAYKSIKPTIYWDYLPRGANTLIQALFTIVLQESKNVLRISFDGSKMGGMEQLANLYDNFSAARDKLIIIPLNLEKGSFDLIEYVYAFHEHLYSTKQVSHCITGYYSVHKRLKANNIPSFLLRTDANIIKEAISKIQNNYIVELGQQSQIATVYIRIDSIREYSLLNDNEYHFIIDKTNVTREIYLYALRLKAAVMEIGINEYILFSTRHMIESVTNNFEKLDLLKSVNENTSSTLSVGIGYGQTAQEAKANAMFGMERASNIGGNAAFVIYDRSNTIGPIFMNKEQKKDAANGRSESKLLSVANTLGISVNTVQRLKSIIEQQGKTQFTSGELARLFGVTQRTMNRLILKLEDNGMCYQTGKQMLTKAGRPRRIVDIVLP